MPQIEWQPIETAPKGDNNYFGPAILAYRPDRIGHTGRICVVVFDPEKYTKRKRPHWHSLWGGLGKQYDRDNPPTHWMPLPEAPDAAA